MAHHTINSGYGRLVERLNHAPQGAPPSDLLDRILALLMSEREADLVARLPIRPFTARRAARLWRTSQETAEGILQELAGRALLLDLHQGEKVLYLLPPPMAGFFEFSMMRVREDLDQKALSELFHRYITEEAEFMGALMGRGSTQMGRAFVHEGALPEDMLHVLDWERASQVVRTASAIGIALCYCRHKTGHLGTACDAPRDNCMVFNRAAESLIRHGHVRPVDVAEGLDILAAARDGGLVQFGENARTGVSFICNCCGCCCEALVAARRFGFGAAVHTTGFLPSVDRSRCTGCGRCVTACPVEAMTLVSANDPRAPKRRVAECWTERCLGCGVCQPACPEAALVLDRRPERVIPPLDNTRRIVAMAVERGRLQNLIFDAPVLRSHRVLGAVLGAVLRLSPVKRAWAAQQMRSRYMERMIDS